MTTLLKRHQFTVEDYYRLADLGMLDDDVRTELLDGEIVEMTPIREPHVEAVDNCNDELQSRRSLDPD